MPVTPTYPGVYIEEIPSGVRTIVGVATSITAFIGRALRGPVNEATTINSYGDFERTFGGLWVESKLGYAVRDFYLNGGSQAIIVRLIDPNFATDGVQSAALAAAKAVADAAKTVTDGGKAAKEAAQKKAKEINDAEGTSQAEKDAAKAAADALNSLADDAKSDAVQKAAGEVVGDTIPLQARLTVGTTNHLVLEAASPGTWGNDLRARVDHKVPAKVPDSYKPYGLDVGDLFNLSVGDMTTGAVETFRNVTVKPSLRQVDNVLKNESKLARVVTMPAAPPEATDAALEADRDGTDPDKAKAAAEALRKPPFLDRNEKRTIGVQDADKGTDGGALGVNDFIGPGLADAKRGLYALEQADLFNLLCLPPYLDGSDESGDVTDTLVGEASSYCEKRRAMLLVDARSNWTDKTSAITGVPTVGTNSKNAALFFPRLKQPNPLHDGQVETFVPCGAVAGVFARTDTQRGVWKAPAGLDATLVGVPELSVPMTDPENGELNPLAINCLRAMPPAGRVVWGSRTLQGDDRLASEWKYVPVRRTALFIEESLYRGTKWVVFEPNDEPLWAQIRLNVGAFMHNLFRQGAFQGKTPREAYLVKCDRETTTQNDINLGIVNILVGFAPLKPAEFVIIKIQQLAGQIEA
jgi:phage tail sheath protein FI